MSEGSPADLFAHAAAERTAAAAPLAERMRPRTAAGIVGQDKVVGEGSFLGSILQGRIQPRSCILWGPPGSGKTTIARLMAANSDYELAVFSAVLFGVKELRALIAKAEQQQNHFGRGTILFVDEIHRFNKAQQDAFLPHVESGRIVLVGATTENPSFEINAPLLSRCRVVCLQGLEPDDIATLVDRALVDEEHGLGSSGLAIETPAREFLAQASAGDVRAALGGLEAAADIALSESADSINLKAVEEGLQKHALLYDKGGDEHYNVISAFIKSMRAGAADAAIYWLARMIEAGEDPIFIARRMVVFASEDIGLADPQALPLAVAAKDAVAFVGMPEARINLGHVTAYLALAPKSRATYGAISAALKEVKYSGGLAVPLHLRNAPTALMKELGYGRRDPVRSGEAPTAQDYLPEKLAARRFLDPD